WSRSGSESSEQPAERAEVEVQLRGIEVELARHVAHGLLEVQQRETDAFDLLGRQRLGVHPADRLAFEELADELDERQHEARDAAPRVVGIDAPARGGSLGEALLERLAHLLEFPGVERRE